MLKIDEVIVIVSEAKTNYERKVIYGLVFCIASCMLTACKEVGAPPLIASSSEQAKTTDSTKDIIPCLEGIEQWYLGNDGCYAKFVSEYSWESDVRRTVRDIDINYFEGMEVYSENRATIVAVIDTDIDTDMFSDKGTGKLSVRELMTFVIYLIGVLLHFFQQKTRPQDDGSMR